MQGKRKELIRLVIFMNHRYEKNLDVIKSLYCNQFDDIVFLIPFYSGNRVDVVPVYESSVFFQGFFAQAFRDIYDEKFSHFLFTADDLILNPSIDCNNILRELKLSDDDGYITSLTPLSDISFEWSHMLRSLQVWSSVKEVEYTRELPDKTEAIRVFDEKGLVIRPITYSNLRGSQGCRYFGFGAALSYLLTASFKEHHSSVKFNYVLKYLCQVLDTPYTGNVIGNLVGLLHNVGLFNPNVSMPFPMVMGYSDVMIVPSASMKEFARLCGVFAAMGLFVEVAIPTAMALACKHVVTEEMTSWHSSVVWGDEKRVELARKYEYSLANLRTFFGHRELFVHPIKLSQWHL